MAFGVLFPPLPEEVTMAPRSLLSIGLLAALPVSAACTIELSPAAVVGDTSVSGTVKLAEPAPATGILITLSSSAPAAQPASEITVLPGHSTVAFTISTSPVAASTHAVISAAARHCSASAGVTVHPASLAAVSLSDVACGGNSGMRGAVVLTGPAPSSGAIVSLQSSDLLVTVPAFVTIAPGQTSADFALSTGQAHSRNAVAVTASYGASMQTALLNVLPGI
jgi:hypothetical protein